MPIIHKNITITGKVQGVGFRFHSVKTAHSFNIKGFVKNLPGGEVYIEAEGDPEQVDLFIEWCHKGPSRASIYNVLVSYGNLVNYRDFDVKY